MTFPKGPELLIILVVVLLLFGARKLPELARSLGQSAKEFRKGVEAGVDEPFENPSTTSSAVGVVDPEPEERPVEPPPVWPYI